MFVFSFLAACGGGGSNSSGNPPVLPATGVNALAAASTPITASGQISALISGGFTLETGSTHGYVDVFTSSSTTYTGAAPFVGEQVTVTGNGSYSTSIDAQTVTQVATASAASPAPIKTPDLLATGGPVVATKTGEFQIDAPVHGYLWIATTASTTFVGGAPKVGDYEEIGGTGSFSSGVTAVIATQTSAAPSSTTATGTVVVGEPYGFALDVSASAPSVPIVLTSTSIVAGGTLEAGAKAAVTGTGETSGSITAVSVVVTDPTPEGSPTPTPGPISQTHVLTADYLGGTAGTTSISWASAAPYLTWAQTVPANANAISAAGIKTQIYTDPNRVETTDPLYTDAPASAFAQTCSGVDVTDFFDDVTQYVMNPASTALQSVYASVTLSEIGSTHFDAIFQDDNGPLSEFSTAFTPSLPCNYSNAAWLAGGIALDNAAPRPVIINGLNVLDGQNPSLSIGLLASSNTIGGNFEGCYTYAGDPENGGWLWVTEENTELEVNAQGKMYSCMERYTDAASSNTAARIYAYASFLLTYNPSLDVLWEEFATPSGFHVFPEEQIVALDPVVATPSTVAGLVQPGGAYGRQYAECFIAGKFVGSCAVAVNSSGASEPFPFPQYTHTLTLSGNGVLDGGSLSTSGAAPPEYLAAEEAEVVFP